MLCAESFIYESKEERKIAWKKYYPDEEDDYKGKFNDSLRNNIYYLYDGDDDADIFLAYFYYKFPPEHESHLKALYKHMYRTKKRLKKYKELDKKLKKYDKLLSYINKLICK